MAGASVTENPTKASRQTSLALGSGVQPWGPRAGEARGGVQPAWPPGAELSAPFALRPALRDLVHVSVFREGPQPPWLSPSWWPPLTWPLGGPPFSTRLPPGCPSFSRAFWGGGATIPLTPPAQFGKWRSSVCRCACRRGGVRTWRKAPGCGGGGALPLRGPCRGQHGGPQRDLPSGQAAEGQCHVPQVMGTKPWWPQAWPDP